MDSNIFVDACSTDGTVELLRKWMADVRGPQADEKIPDVDNGCMSGWVETDDGRYTFRWISEPDKGQSDAINKGFRMATGDIFGWLNADDYLKVVPNHISTIEALNDSFFFLPFMSASLSSGSAEREIFFVFASSTTLR
jgi:glycosyltransferase involved in cell wall biosynthesis